MNNLWSREKVILGGGGIQPGVDVLDPDTRQLQKILKLAAGESVYAIDMSPDENMLAAGTKTGFLYLLEKDSFDSKDEFQVKKLIHGSSVLDVCFIDSFNLAVTDVSGRCLLWRLGVEKTCRQIHTANNVLCCLFKISANQMAAISVDGKLLIWDLTDFNIIENHKIPKPPALSALLRPVYWPAKKIWLWPGEGGLLVKFDSQTSNINTISAHKKDFYAISVFDDEIITIGKDESILKRWRVDEGNITSENISAPDGVIMAACWGDKRRQLLLATDQGNSAIYQINNGHLEYVHEMPNQHYRIAVGPDIDEYRLGLKQRKTNHAERICSELENKINSHKLTNSKHLYEKLTELGFEHVSLIFKAKEAAKNDDIVGELKYLNRLYCLIKRKKLNITYCFDRLAYLLERTWRLTKAQSVYKELGHHENAQRLSALCNIIESDNFIIEADIEISALINSATILNESFTGCYCFRQVASDISLNIDVTPDKFIELYEILRKQNGGASLPPAAAKKVRWLSDGKSQQAEVIVFSATKKDSNNGIELGIKIIRSLMQTTMTPVLLFDIEKTSEDISPQEHNDKVLIEFNKFKGNLSAHGQLRKIHSSINLAIRQFINQSIRENSLIGEVR